MLKQSDVDSEEERLRNLAGKLPDESRKALFGELRGQIKDPDTYAVLNWFFPIGIHHLYLRRWFSALADIGLIAIGIVLLVLDFLWVGVILIGVVSAWELWALFRSQIIVQDWNNQVYRSLLDKYGA
ncbi:TM2 domain-containing protein [Marinobacter sp. JSM 1782161]|uniref:TM2 domain-containing protein n=1 Tax=Marinobacter sp. JSM 1782161 TaxID=2685906 RepID=UPI001402F4A1|nr:TM2 domain-containing protein [Marinobacter sp. JSM 1782161]